MPGDKHLPTSPLLVRAAVVATLAAGLAAAAMALPERPVREFRRVSLMATITVLPVRLDGVADAEGAALVARRLGREGVSHGCVVGAPVDLGAAGSLAELVAALTARLAAAPADSDFVLLVDYRAGRAGPAVVDVILCDARGAVVVAEERAADATAITRGDQEQACSDAVAGALAAYLAGASTVSANAFRP